MSEKLPLPDDLVRDIERLAPQLALLDHYQLLGVTETATDAEIKQAYLRLVQRFHPDRWHSRESGAHRKRMEAIFSRATEAYEVLRYASSRLEYDRSLYEIRGIPRPSAAPRVPVAPSPPPARPAPPPPPSRAGAAPPPAPPGIVRPPTPTPSTPSARPVERSPSQAKLMAARMMQQLRPVSTPGVAVPPAVAAPPPAAPTPTSTSTPAPGASKVPILVVEDDEALRTMLVRILSDLGEVIAAPDGAAALRVLERDPVPRLVVTDVMMPNIDGLELARRMKGNPRLARVPIVMLTAKQGPKDMIEGVNAGARFYVTKPFKVDELKSKVKKAMGI